MSRVDPGVDIGALARPEENVKPPKRRLLRVVVPTLLLGGFALVVLSTLGDVLGGAVPVSLVRPEIVTATDAASFASSTPLLQAAGWVEPDPYPILVTALTEGVVEQVFALEGAVVKRGEPLARLVDEDRRIALSIAEAEVAEAEAEARRAKAEADIALESFTAALAVSEAAHVANEEKAATVAARNERGEAVEKGEAQVRVAEAELALQKELAKNGAAPPWAVDLAEAELQKARSDLSILKAQLELAWAEARKAAFRQSRASQERALRFDDRRARDVSAAEAERAAAAVVAALAKRGDAVLALERTTVRAPEDGVVLERLVAPGSPVGPSAPPAFTLYDPKSIRVRVDVPQGDVAKLLASKRAEIRSESRGDRPYQGEVSRVVHRADIQKVTLQAHVRIDEPDALLRPEMLCQVRFFSGGTATRPTDGGKSGATRLRVPSRLVKDGYAWVLDPTAPRAKRVRIEVGARDDAFVEVLSGIDLSSKILDAGGAELTEGARVRVGKE